MTIGVPEFYREVLRAWGSFLETLDLEPVGTEAILNQPLFFNPNLNIGGGDFWTVWFKGGFRKIRDLLYEVRPGLLPLEAFIDEITRVKDDYAVGNIKKELDLILNAIPEEWMMKIHSTGGEAGEKDGGVQISMKEEGVGLQGLVLRHFYLYFRKKAFIAPASNNYWLRLVDGLEAGNIWKNADPEMSSFGKL